MAIAGLGREVDMVCPRCFSGELYREYEPERSFGEDLTEYLEIGALCKMCDQETKFLYIICEEVGDGT